MTGIKKNFTLSPQAIDEIAQLITDFCTEAGSEKKDTLRYRLSAEECLLYWLEHGLDGADLEIQTGKYMHAPYITLDAKGTEINPYAEDDDDYGIFTDNVLVRLGLTPEYSYINGRNRIRFRIKKKERGQIATLCMVIAAAAGIGVLGKMFIPESIINILLSSIIDPVYNTFFNILGCIAGPMIFLSVAWGVYGIGDTATFGRIGKKMMLCYVSVAMIASVCASVFFPIMGLGLSGGQGQGGEFSSISELILGIFPSTIVEPFETGNTLQIIFMAIIIGIALLFLGRQTSSIARAIEQVNILVQFLMTIISKLVPFVIFLVIVNMIWSDSLSVFASVWQLIVLLIAAFVLTAAAFIIFTGALMKVSPLLLLKKSMPAFLVALTTASSAAAFGTNVNTCEKQFGIEQSLIRFGIPLGMVMHKPITAVYNLLLVFFFAKEFGVSCSLGWIAVAVFISAIIAISVPPIPGGGAIGYSILFLQMGIPGEALAIALAIDVITDFLITSFEVLVLPMTLINISHSLAMIDRETLSAPVK